MIHDIDFANILVRAVDMVADWPQVELCALTFNTPISIGAKTRSTLVGLADVFQLTSRPFVIMIDAEYHADIVRYLLRAGVAVVKAEADEPRRGMPAKGVTFPAFCRVSRRVSGPLLARVLERAGVTVGRFVQIGDKCPVQHFQKTVLPFVVKGKHVIDLGAMLKAQKDEIPLAFLHANNDDDAKKRAETLNTLGELGIENNTPCGGIGIIVNRKTAAARAAAGSSGVVEYAFIYPALVHYLRALDMPDRVRMDLTQKQARTLRRTLADRLVHLSAKSNASHIKAISRYLRVEVRAVINGTGAAIDRFVSSTQLTLDTVYDLTGVSVGIRHVPFAAYVALLKTTFGMLENPAYRVGFGDQRKLAPPIVIARLCDVLDIIGFHVGFRSINFVNKRITWNVRLIDATKADIHQSLFIWVRWLEG